jgi:hypothetical protein
MWSRWPTQSTPRAEAGDSHTRVSGVATESRKCRLRQAAATKNRVVRVVDQKTAVVPLDADTLANPTKILASVRSLVDLA